MKRPGNHKSDKLKKKITPNKLLFIFLPVFFCGTYSEEKYYAVSFLSSPYYVQQKKILVQSSMNMVSQQLLK